MIELILGFVVILGIYYVLYMNGVVSLNGKKAATFMGAPGGKRASFSMCNGATKRVIKFKESKTYEFIFTPELSKGDISLTLLDTNKKKVLVLNNNTRTGSVEAEAGKRYFMIIQFRTASGKYEIDWK